MVIYGGIVELVYSQFITKMVIVINGLKFLQVLRVFRVFRVLKVLKVFRMLKDCRVKLVLKEIQQYLQLFHQILLTETYGGIVA